MKWLGPEQTAAYEHSVKRADIRRRWLEGRHKAKPRCHYCKNVTTYEPGMSSKPGNKIGAMFATLDHVIPLSRGGQDHSSNWVLACFTCNCLKADMSAAGFIAELKEAGVR